jgi:hypothetical protein
MALLPEQEELLVQLVEAARRVPRPEQTFTHYHLPSFGNDAPDCVIGAGIEDRIPVLGGDVGELNGAGYIRYGSHAWGDHGIPFTITSEGFRAYEELRERDPDASAAIEQEVRRYLDGSFQSRYPAAYERLAAAEQMLWQADPSSDFTTIGHKTREATQQFATALVDRYAPPGVDPDPAKAKSRLRAVVDARRDALGTAKAELLTSLAEYHDGVNAVIQRQEHGDQKPGEPLTWEDARVAVFHTAILLHEYDRLLNLPSGS